MAQVLVVDDEEGVRELLAEVLEGADHEVFAVASGEEALRELGRRGFALMVTDLKMPGMDGTELLTRAKQMQPELEIILITAHGTIDIAVQAMKLGAFDFLQKPLSSPDELRLLAARALERRSLLAIKERESRDDSNLPALTYGDPIMVPVVEALRKVAPTDATLLLTGESGTGKEVAARAVHRWSQRAQGPWMAVNCAALSEHLLESELFGHEKGAFTGATSARRGRIELAAGGTFFLDEIAELKPALQAKLLRVLQERSFERVGGSRTLQAEVRWIAATNRNLEAMVEAGSFREDLYHRVAVFPVELPPLRARKEDLLPLARGVLAQVAANLGRGGLELSQAAERTILAGEWRGNIRELINTLERAAIIADGSRLDTASLAQPSRSPTQRPGAAEPHTLADLEKAAILRTLEAVGGNRRQAAEQLGIGLRTLYEKLKRYELGGK